MLKQTRIGFVITMVALFAFPTDAMAGGGLGLFKCFRAKRATCCPPPKCEPCPPITCQPCAPVMDAPCTETETATYGQCWYAVGTPCGTQSLCVGDPGVAIKLAQRNDCYAYTLYPCSTCIAGSGKDLDDVPASKDSNAGSGTKQHWKVFEIYLDRNGNVHKRKIHEKTDSEAWEAAKEGLKKNGRMPPNGKPDTDGNVVICYVVSY